MARRPKRIRWSATTEKNGVTKVTHALGYTKQDAIDAWNFNGHKVLTVPVRVQRGEASGGRKAPVALWYLNTENLALAIEYLGLKRRVEIKQTGHAGGRRGVYSVEPGRQHHVIRVKNWLTAEEASRTLWHELTHALQTERGLSEAEINDLYTAWKYKSKRYDTKPGRKRRINYENRPGELEARKNEALAEELPLARPTNAGRRAAAV